MIDHDVTADKILLKKQANFVQPSFIVQFLFVAVWGGMKNVLETAAEMPSVSSWFH